MKTIITLSITFISFTVAANDAKYVDAMKKNIELLYSAQSAEEYQRVVNTFERIGSAEKNKWEPYYYAAFGNIMMANLEKNSSQKDIYLDEALKSVEKAKLLAAQDSEVIAMEGFVHMIRLTVDPASRGQQYSNLAFQSFNQALQLNPDNPRALSLLSSMQFGTAQFFGSSTKEACDTAAKAMEKFDTFTSDNPLAPVWGKEMTMGQLKQCQ